jgi:hypothetical protein
LPSQRYVGTPRRMLPYRVTRPAEEIEVRQAWQG